MYVREDLLNKARQVLSKYYMGAEGCWRFQDRIKGWGLKYVSVQLTLSTYKLVSDDGAAGLWKRFPLH